MGERNIITSFPSGSERDTGKPMLVVVGSSVIDTIGSPPQGSRQVIRRAQGLPEGAKVKVVDRRKHVGGNGTNMATAIGDLRNGVYPVLYTYVGNDTNGERIVREVTKKGVHVVAEVGEYETDSSLVVVTGNDRVIIRLTPEEEIHGGFEADRLPNRPHLATLLTTVDASSWESVYPQVVAHTRERKGRTQLAVSPGTPQLDDIHNPTLHHTLQSADIVCLNKHELQRILEARNVKPAEKVPDLLDQAATSIGEEIVFSVTDGGEGSYVRIPKGTIIYAPAFEDTQRTPLVNTLGAGDTHTATFVEGMVTGRGVKTSLARATVNAHSVTRHDGAQEGRLPSSRITKLIAETGYEARVVFDPTGNEGPSYRRSHTAIPLS